MLTFSKEDTKAVKGSAIMLMLYHHLFAFPDRIADDITYFSTFEIAGNSISFWIGAFGKLCVALFLFLGGYGTYITCSKSSDISKTITQRIKSLYLSYWKIFVIFIPICMLMGVPRVTVNLQDLIWNFTGLKISYCGEWWFFTPYVGLLFLYPVIYKRISKASSPYTDLFVVLLLNLIVTYILPNINDAWTSTLSDSLFWDILFTTLKHSPSFLMGCVFAKHDIFTKLKLCLAGKLTGYLGALLVLLLTFYMRKKVGSNMDYLLAPIYTAALAIFMESKPGRVFHRISSRIGSESTTMWLVHSIYCYLLCQHLVFLPKYTLLIFLWLLLLSYATAIAIRKFYALLKRAADFMHQKTNHSCESH